LSYERLDAFYGKLGRKRRLGLPFLYLSGAACIFAGNEKGPVAEDPAPSPHER